MQKNLMMLAKEEELGGPVLVVVLPSCGTNRLQEANMPHLCHDCNCCYCHACRMSDLLLPFLLLLDDDALAFWCFVSLMQRMGARHNFAVDERGIFDQLRMLGQVGTAADTTCRAA